MQIEDREAYFKVVTAVETGYNVDVYTLRVPFNMMPAELIARQKVSNLKHIILAISHLVEGR